MLLFTFITTKKKGCCANCNNILQLNSEFVITLDDHTINKSEMHLNTSLYD